MLAAAHQHRVISLLNSPNTHLMSSPWEAELGEDPLAGERADVAEEKHLAGRHPDLPAIQPDPGSSGARAGCGW